MEKPKVLLLYPPNQMWPIETPRPDGSIGPLYLAGALEAAGFEADILDTTVGSKDDSLADTFYRSIMQVNGLTRIGMSLERIRNFVLAGKYNIVGISSNFTSQTRMALEVAAEIKQANPDIWVIAGGGNARNLWSRFLNGSFDLVCLTEGERIIVEIAKEWPGGFERISGVAYKKEGRQIVNPVKPDDIYSKLDQLPFPAWEKLLFDKYDQIASPHGVVVAKEKHRCAPVMTSRGCPYRCEYCHVSYEKLHPEAFGPIGNLRFKSVSRVMEEIFRLKGLGVSRIFFEDDSLLADKKRVKAIFEQVSNLGLTIADVNGVNLVHFLKRIEERLTVDEEFLELLKSSGFDQIVFPVESASQRIIKKYASSKLDLSRFDVVELAKIANRVGIACPINMMIGFPDETEEEMRQSINLGKKLVDAGAPYCTFFIPIPFPGTNLFETAIKEGYLSPDFDPDLMNWKNVNAVMINTTVAPERIAELRDQAWREVNTAEHVEMRLSASIGSRSK